jgi:shikimate dehydrogenase
MFSRVLQRIGISAVYVPFNVRPEMIGQAMQSLRVLNIDGATVSTPHKETVIPHMNILSEGAKIIGAVNTVIRTGDQLKGYNTNAIGFMDALEEIGFDVNGKTALVVGTGGEARAVVFILNWLRAGKIVIAGRSRENLDRVMGTIGGESILLKELSGRNIRADILINATSISSPDQSPELAAIAASLEVRDLSLVVDLNYGYPDSFWRKAAEARGLPFMDGLPALAHSARRTLLLWTRVDVEPMEFVKALDAAS